jgi:CRP-like cAMP-binding protein
MEGVLEVCADLPDVAFAPGEVVLREGGRDGRIFVLISGTVAVMKGDVRVTRIRNPGALFGEMSVLLGMPYSATVVAETPVRMRLVQDGEAFLRSTPEVALHAARLLAQRLHDTTTYLADLKAQFEGRTDHFGMVDRIIGTLLNHQTDRNKAAALPTEVKGDSRL